MDNKLLQSLKHIAHLRMKIFGEEVRLEKMRAIRAAWMIVFGFAFLQIFLATVLALGIVLTQGDSRVWFLAILGGISLFGALAFFYISLQVFSPKTTPFAATVAEFRKDKECLESVLKK